jgi:hypothetical protein
VSQARVETVMEQALPVMGGMASQNVLNLVGLRCFAVTTVLTLFCSQNTRK